MIIIVIECDGVRKQGREQERQSRYRDSLKEGGRRKTEAFAHQTSIARSREREKERDKERASERV